MNRISSGMHLQTVKHLPFPSHPVSSAALFRFLRFIDFLLSVCVCRCLSVSVSVSLCLMRFVCSLCLSSFIHSQLYSSALTAHSVNHTQSVGSETKFLFFSSQHTITIPHASTHLISTDHTISYHSLFLLLFALLHLLFIAHSMIR